MINHLIESEHQIQSQILEFLNYSGIYAWRSNAGRYSVGEGRNRRMIIGAPAGTPDLIGIIGPNYKNGTYVGRFLGIEVKKPGKDAMPLQLIMLAQFAKYGAIVFVSHSLEELQEQLGKL